MADLAVDLDGALELASPLPPDRRPDLVYLARLGSSKSRRTQAGAIRALCLAMVPPGSGRAPPAPELVPWHALGYQHTQAIRARLAEACAPATANRYLAALRGVLREARRLGLMSADAAAQACDFRPVPGKRIPKGRALSSAEILAMLGACDGGTPAGARDAALVAMAYNGGLRREELAHATVGDLAADGELRILGKGQRERLVYIPWAAPYVAAWLGYRGREPGPLFTAIDRWGNRSPRALSDQGVAVIICAVARRAGVENVTPHDMRRTCLTSLLDQGVDLATVQQFAGHADPRTTALYDRGGERRKRIAGALLDPTPVPEDTYADQ